MRNTLTAIYSLFLFKPYTIFPRVFEVLCGIQAWFNLGVVIFCIYKIIITN